MRDDFRRAASGGCDRDELRIPIGWALFVAALVAFTIVVLATVETGLDGDPRTANPNPGPAPYESSPLTSPIASSWLSAAQTAALLLVSALVPVAGFSAARLAGLARPSYDEFPFPEAKVYDPYGELERAGKPGPFYR